MPLTVVQITDPHIGSDWGGGGAAELASAIESVHRVLRRAPDAVVVSGDIADTASEDEYRQARALLERFAAPVYVVPGNHDDRGPLRDVFELPDDGASHVGFNVDLGPLRIVGLDSQRPGDQSGQFDSSRREWLDRVLSEAPAKPTLLFMHHPPLVTGVPSIDSMALPEPEQRELEEVIARHERVELIAAGHVHRVIVGRLAHARVLAIPSTDIQVAMDFENPQLRLVREPPCFAVHVQLGGEIVSHLQMLPLAD